MEVILREDIEKLGSRGDVVKVAPGYARNWGSAGAKDIRALDSSDEARERGY